ncbi:hypothetical protein ACVWZ6_000325 [Bradyrhizobium sp. GM6.1]
MKRLATPRALAVSMRSRGTGAIEIVAGEVEAYHLTQLRQGEFGLDQLVEFVLKSIGFSLRAADEGADAGQDLDLVGTAIEGAGLALDVGIERRRRLQCLMRRENCLREPGGERAAVVGGAGLYVDRPSLRRPRDVQRATNAKMLADMVERVDLAGVGEDARSRIVDERVILPAIPQPGDHVEIFAGALIALVVRGMFRQPKVLCGLLRTGGDDVPAGATPAEMVERRKQPCQIVRLGIGR